MGTEILSDFPKITQLVMMGPDSNCFGQSLELACDQELILPANSLFCHPKEVCIFESCWFFPLDVDTLSSFSLLSHLWWLGYVNTVLVQRLKHASVISASTQPKTSVLPFGWRLNRWGHSSRRWGGGGRDAARGFPRHPTLSAENGKSQESWVNW